MQERADKLRQMIARYERLVEGAPPELREVYAAEIAAVRAMLAKIEAAALQRGADDTDPKPKADPPAAGCRQ